MLHTNIQMDSMWERDMRSKELFMRCVENKDEVKDAIIYFKGLKNKEWSGNIYNIISSNSVCKNDCGYCYMKSLNQRFGRVEEGVTMDLEDLFVCNEKRVEKKWRKTKNKKVIMFPSSHDIFDDMVDKYISVVKKILDVDNYVMCVSKPRLSCIEKICNAFNNDKYRDKIFFRFTISTKDDELMRVWEKNTPFYKERLECLKYCFDKGFKTSVSMEPFFNINLEMIDEISKYVTNDIWLGEMSDIGKVKGVDEKYKKDLYNLYDEENLIKIVRDIGNREKIRFKASFCLKCLKHILKKD
jgi:DNA repair photolyase